MMMKTNKIVSSGLGLALGLSAVVGFGLPAGAAESENTIGGYTESSFVEAAADYGVDASVAAAAWGDVDAMSSIPVSGEANVSSAFETRAAGWSKTCSWSNTNLFGAALQTISISKAWHNRLGVANVTDVFSTGSGGVGWWFESITASNDYFSGNNHGSYRQGLYKMTDVDGSQVGFNVHATFVVKPDGTYECTGGVG